MSTAVDMDAVDGAARTNLNVVDLARYDDYKKRLLADDRGRAEITDALHAFISVSTKVEDQDPGA